MTPRIFLIALLGGVLTAAAGYVPLMAVPCLVVPNWNQALPAAPIILIWSGVALTLLFLTGLAAGWFSQARTPWGVIGAGALAGWVAAWVAEALLVGIIAGLWGAKNLLAHGLVPAADDVILSFLVAESAQSIVLWVHASMALTALAGILLGALGGAVSGLPGARRSKPDLPFALRVSGAMNFVSSLTLAATIFIYAALAEISQDFIENSPLPSPYPAHWIFDAPVALSLLWWLLWVVLTWAFLRQSPAGTPIGFFSSLAFWAAGAAVGLPITIFSSGLIHSSTAEFIPYLITLALIAALIFFGAGLALALLVPQRAWGFFTRRGETRFMAWALLVINGLLFLGFFNAGPGEGWRHPWLTLGLLAGIAFGLDAVRRSRRAAEPPQPAPSPLSASGVFGTAFSTFLLTNLTLALTALAPLALTMLPIVAIQYIMPEASPTETGDAISLVSAYLAVTILTMGAALLASSPVASLMSLMMWKLWQRVSQYLAKS